MEILQHIWGATPEGEAIVIYTLRNENGCEVQVCNIGAAIVSVKAPDRDGNMDDIVLGYKDAMSYFGDGAASGKSVGRVANRIAKGKMTIEGVEYNLEINNGPNHLHGGTKGFANQLWDSRVEENRVVFSRTSPDGEQNYPGDLYVEAGYYFGEDNALEITYMARTNKTTAVNLTNHTYWNLAGEGSGKDILDHELRLNCSKVLEMDPTQIPTGVKLDVKGTPQDFTEWRRFGDDIAAEYQNIDKKGGYGHFFPRDEWRKGELQEIGVLRDKRSGRAIRFLSTQAGCMVYTGNKLSVNCPDTLSGGRYANYAGVAIECQGFVDAVNNPHFPSIMLHKGEHYHEQTIYKFELVE